MLHRYAMSVPPYNNPPIHPEYFQPSVFFIQNVQLGQTTIVTTSKNQNYAIGQLVRLLIPSYSGCVQLNQQTGYVLSIPSPNQVELSIDSSQNTDPFLAASFSNQPQIIAVGDVSNGYISATGVSVPVVAIPGSFVNISPI